MPVKCVSCRSDIVHEMVWTSVAVLLVAAASVAASEDSVLTFKASPELRMTSSTLRWIGAHDGARPDNAVVATVEIVPAEGATTTDDPGVDAIKEQPVHVCRARHNGVWVPGQLRTGAAECQVSLERVTGHRHYEVLENTEMGARLSWVKWSRHSPRLEVGAVAGGDSYVARRRRDVPEGTVLGPRHLVGRYDPHVGIGRVIVIDSQVPGQELDKLEFQDGETLVETEPTTYEVNGLNFQSKRRKDLKTPRQLGSAVLRNDETDGGEVKVETVVAYDFVFSTYWGQGRAMLKGLNTTVRLPNGNLEEIQWGIKFQEEHKDVYRVEAMLGPGTAVNVSVWGNETESEVPYSGTLVAVYPDLKTRARPISGTQLERTLQDLRAVFGPVYWLHNNSLAPTTTTTTTSTTTTTTTTTTTLPPPYISVNDEDNTVQVDDLGVHDAVALKKNISLAGAGQVPSGSIRAMHSALMILGTVLRIGM